jgi:hypothetical protein
MLLLACHTPTPNQPIQPIAIITVHQLPLIVAIGIGIGIVVLCSNRTSDCAATAPHAHLVLQTNNPIQSPI